MRLFLSSSLFLGALTPKKLRIPRFLEKNLGGSRNWTQQFLGHEPTLPTTRRQPRGRIDSAKMYHGHFCKIFQEPRVEKESLLQSLNWTKKRRRKRRMRLLLQQLSQLWSKIVSAPGVLVQILSCSLSLSLSLSPSLFLIFLFEGEWALVMQAGGFLSLLLSLSLSLSLSR